MIGRSVNNQLERSKPLNDLDDKLFDFEKQVDPNANLLEYIRKNRSKFYFCGLMTDPRAT